MTYENVRKRSGYDERGQTLVLKIKERGEGRRKLDVYCS